MADFSIDIDSATGRMRVETGDMSGPHHASADEFIAMIEKLMGGTIEKKSKRKGLKHSHHNHSGHHHEHKHEH